jgi:hypothetical protein
MKINEKILQLVKSGLKATMLTTLSESQINSLHSRLVESKKATNEETQVVTKRFDKNNPSDLAKLNQMLKTPDTLKNQNVEVKEGEQEVDEKFESKKQQKYFFAKCGEGKTKEQKKWCKMADEFAKKTNFDKLPEKKTETNEEGEAVYQKTAENLMAKVFQNSAENTIPGFTIGESNLEKQITQLVEKHISPKMSKKDFINTIKNIMVESPKKYPSVKRNLKLPIMGLNEDENENELPDWLTAKAIGF